MIVRKLNVKKLIVFCVTVLLILFGLVVGVKKMYDDKKMKETYEYKLSVKGYSQEEIDYLKQTLNNEQLDFMLDKDYEPLYLKLLKNKYFQFNKFDNYVKYVQDNNMLDIDLSIALVNVGADREWYSKIQDTDVEKGILMIVNKFNKLTEEYVPKLVNVSSRYAYAGKQVAESAYEDLVDMLDSARSSGYTLVVTQGYRSYKEQEKSYNTYKSANSTKAADEFVARPGHSEYQSGLSMDIEPYNKKVEDATNNEEHKWLLKNAYKYGFILRYQENKEDITGFNYNPWRFRYVGKEAAKVIFDNNLTFDEYYYYYVI